MGLHPKHPYEKPSITIIPVGTPRYEELMQAISQEQDNTDNTTVPADSCKVEVTNRV